MVAEPFEPPAQLTMELDAKLTVGATGLMMVADVVFVHPFASVTVTVYVPAHNPVAVAEVCPLLQA